MKVMTWNVWFGRHKFVPRSHALRDVIVRTRPEVVALQEVTPPLRTWLDEQLAGYTLFGGDSIFGYDVLLATRVPVIDHEVLELPSEMGRRVIAARLENGLVVATVHLESTAPCIRERCAQLELIMPWLEKNEHAILVGDMNFDDFAARESDRIDDAWIDAWPALHPGKPGYTVDSTKNKMRVGIGKATKRIDRVFVRSTTWRPTAIEMLGVEPIDPETWPSDHFGLMTTFSA